MKLENFWTKVDRSAGAGACWPWLGTRMKNRPFPSENGYGMLMLSVAGKTVAKRSHRVAWELTNGSIPGGLSVLHHCDRPWCCNPSHLYLGTNRENVLDRVRRNRTPAGSRHYATHLNEVAVRVIRYFLERGMPQARLAKAYGVSHRIISNINIGKTWKHVA